MHVKYLLLYELLSHLSLPGRKTDFINEMSTSECGCSFQWCPKYLCVGLGEGSIIRILCKAAVYISVSELFGEDKSINICKKLRDCIDKNHKNIDK